MQSSVVPGTDAWLPASWRGRPGSFVALMTLYESNWHRLAALLPRVRELEGVHVSRAPGECDLLVSVIEHSRYTSVLCLTYLFDEEGTTLEEPALEVRVYHDAGLAEACRAGAVRTHAGLRRLEAQLPATLDERWRRNVMLNKWLEYLVDTGHGLARAHEPR